jgi:hypothetical protein
LDAPAACVDAAPAKGTKWYNEIGIDPQGVYIVSTVASAAAKNGGLLGPTPQTQIDASKTLSGAMPCTPCHGTTCGAQAVATAVARLGHASLPFDFTVSNSISTVTVTRSIDCTGPSDSKTSFAYMIAIRFVFPALPPGERTTGFVLTGSPGHIKPGQLRPVGNNSDQFACTSTASLDLALGSIAQNANVTFQGRAQILGLKAAITNNPLDADSGAQAAGRLGSMTLVDVLDGGN